MSQDILDQLVRQSQQLTPKERWQLVSRLQGNETEIPPKLSWDVVRSCREEIVEIATKYGASQMRVRSSSAEENGTIEFIVKLAPGRSLLDLGGLLMELRNQLGDGVFVTSEGGLPMETRSQILDEAIEL